MDPCLPHHSLLLLCNHLHKDFAAFLRVLSFLQHGSLEPRNAANHTLPESSSLRSCNTCIGKSLPSRIGNTYNLTLQSSFLEASCHDSHTRRYGSYRVCWGGGAFQGGDFQVKTGSILNPELRASPGIGRTLNSELGLFSLQGGVCIQRGCVKLLQLNIRVVCGWSLAVGGPQGRSQLKGLRKISFI